MSKHIVTRYGWFESPNCFITTDGEVLNVRPYNYILELYYDKIPCGAFINCYKNPSGDSYTVCAVLVLD